jgi:hypothetical protein
MEIQRFHDLHLKGEILANEVIPKKNNSGILNFFLRFLRKNYCNYFDSTNSLSQVN